MKEFKKRLITPLVREQMPKILKDSKDGEGNYIGLSFNELFGKLKKVYPDELVFPEDGRDRIGILQGIANKMGHIPVENVRKETKNNEVLFIYVPDKITELSIVLRKFHSNINEQGFTSMNVLELNNIERDFYNKFIKSVIEMDDALNLFDAQKREI